MYNKKKKKKVEISHKTYRKLFEVEICAKSIDDL